MDAFHGLSSRRRYRLALSPSATDAALCSNMCTYVHLTAAALALASLTQAAITPPVQCTTEFTDVSAADFVQRLNPGWNLGNTLEASPDEGSWNNAKVTPPVFKTARKSGFNGVRIPVTYADHYVGGSPGWAINATWLQRVSDVVDMATAQGFYLVTNMHHDSWKWADVTQPGANLTMIHERFYASWLQIARALACKPSTVALEPINEPPATTAEHGEQINILNQLFLKALADAGGHNARRVVTLVGGGEDGQKTAAWFARPAQNTTNPWALQYHYYSPCTSSTRLERGKSIWGSADEEAALAADLSAVRGNFTDVPILIGEFSASQANCEASARWRYTDLLVRTARNLSTSIMLWDNGLDNLDRPAGTWRDPTSLALIVQTTTTPEPSNSLPRGTTDDSATTQASSAYIFQRVGAPTTAQALPFEFNGNAVTSIVTSRNDRPLGSTDYAVNSSHIIFSAAFLGSYLSPNGTAGRKANLTVNFSEGVSVPIEIVQWDTPVLASVTSLATTASASSDLVIPVIYKGLPKLAAVRMANTTGGYLVDTWTAYLGPLQQGRVTYSNQYSFDDTHVIITSSAVRDVVTSLEPAVFTFEFYPRVPGNAVNYTLTVEMVFALAGASFARWSNSSSPITLTVNSSATYQTVDGFGFCEAFQRANSLYNATAPVQKAVLDLLFDKANGAGLSILRLGLGSSPNTTQDHMNSIEPASPFNSSSLPTYSWDRNASGQVWMAHQAQSYGVSTFYADAWSAPGFMKTNGRDDEGGFLRKEWAAAYVNYLVEYVRAWTVTEGVPLRHVGFVNEPNVVKPYATMQLPGVEGNMTAASNRSVASASDIIRPLAAALEASNDSAVSSTGISCCEAQGWSMARAMLPSLKDTVDDASLRFITTHAYKGSPGAPDSPLDTSLPVWITENSPIMQRLGFSDVWYNRGRENEGLTWANNLHTALVNGNVSAYLYWIGAGGYGSEVPLVWLHDRNYSVAATYWATAHYSRFVRPGAVRVGVDTESDSSPSVRSSAFKNTDGSYALQVINNGDSNGAVTLYAPPPRPRQSRTITRYVTDNNHRLQI
ncbi:hypothetical protein SCUCBS95973_001960 [Sporothrix curviconia]|uniref:Glycoside hydrolase family 5 protein n=1 Tax=Sporothrix curviconia TaxID=1260050 RepID=A0ABP0B309_9PEZI